MDGLPIAYRAGSDFTPSPLFGEGVFRSLSPNPFEAIEGVLGVLEVASDGIDELASGDKLFDVDLAVAGLGLRLGRLVALLLVLDDATQADGCVDAL